MELKLLSAPMGEKPTLLTSLGIVSSNNSNMSDETMEERREIKLPSVQPDKNSHLGSTTSQADRRECLHTCTPLVKEINKNPNLEDHYSIFKYPIKSQGNEKEKGK